MPQPDQFMHYGAVYGLMERDGRVFVLRRFNTGFADGLLHFPAGHIEAGELPVQAVAREVKEETGVDVREGDIEPVHVQFYTGHHIGDRTYTNYYFKIKDWQGEPHMAEPEKANEACWLEMADLPEDFLRFQRVAIDAMAEGAFFSQFVMEEGDRL